MLRGLVCNKEKLFHTKVEMITHSVHTFRNCSVVHDLSVKITVQYYINLYVRRGKKLNNSEKKGNSWTKSATVISSKNIEGNKMKS